MSLHTAVRHRRLRIAIRLLGGATVAAIFGAATPLHAQEIDLACSSPSGTHGGSITVYDKALGGYPHAIVKTIEAGKSYEVTCRYTVNFPIAWNTFSLPPWQIRLQADGQVLHIANGAQTPEQVFGQMGIGTWSGLMFAEWTPKPASGHGILCALDITNAVKESNGNNNTCTRSFGPGVSARPPRPGEIKMQAKAPGSGVVPPQEPPSGSSGSEPKGATATRGTGERVALNPQPEPPSSRQAKRRPDATAAAPAGGPNVSPSKLVTTAAVLQPAQPSAGQKIKVVATVRNEGGLPSQRGTGVLLVCREVPGQPKCPMTGSSSTTLPSLGTGQSYQASISPGVTWPAGRYELVVGTDVIFLNDTRTVELVVKP